MARTKEEATGETTPRARGRPAASGTGVQKAYVPTGRPRGRPPKSVKPQSATAYVPTGRPRGRPKGSGKIQKKTKAASASATAPAAAPAKRGRPRKSDAAATPKPKGRRGRKPKTPAEPHDEPEHGTDGGLDAHVNTDLDPESDVAEEAAGSADEAQHPFAAESGEESEHNG